jgi:hypothetical protein
LIEEFNKRTDGDLPLFISDELPRYENALLKEYGIVQIPKRTGRPKRPKKPKVIPCSDLDYVQVVKKREKGRIVDISRRTVFGSPERISHRLEESPVSNKVNTAHLERNNLTLRQNNRRLTRKTNGFWKEKADVRKTTPSQSLL